MPLTEPLPPASRADHGTRVIVMPPSTPVKPFLSRTGFTHSNDVAVSPLTSVRRLGAGIYIPRDVPEPVRLEAVEDAVGALPGIITTTSSCGSAS